jgi:hypothetical protein
MKLLLAFLLGAILVGLATDRLDARTYALIIVGAIGTTVLYYGLTRFMV